MLRTALRRRFFSSGARPWRSARSLHVSRSAAATAAEKHPDAQRAKDLAGPQTDNDPTAGTLGAPHE
jgi:hypothetical protein